MSAAAAPLAGWAFPWGLRARVAELLLRGMFDTLDEGQYTDHRQELLNLLQVRTACLWLGQAGRKAALQSLPVPLRLHPHANA